MRVLLAINTLSTGGAEVFTAALANALSRCGCNVVVYLYAGVLDAKGKALAHGLSQNGIRIVTPNARTSGAKLLAIPGLARLIASFQPDIVHSNLEQTDFMIAVASRLVGRRRFKLVRTLHSVYAIKSLPSIMHRWLISVFDAHVACGEVVLRQYPYMGDSGNRIDNGIEIFNPPEKVRGELRAALNIPAHSLVLVNIGSFDRRNGTLPKAQDVIVDALSKVENSNLVVLFLGDGEERSILEARAETLGVLPRLKFLGRVVDVPAYLAMCDLVLMPSRFEGLPLGAIEAACAGKPLIVSDIEQFVPFERAAITVPAEDVTALARVMDACVDQLPALTATAEALVAEYSERFSIDTTSQRYIDLYRKLLGADLQHIKSVAS